MSKPPIARLELGSGAIGGYASTQEKLHAAFEAAGVIFVEANGDGPGVRMKKTVSRDDLTKTIETLDDSLAKMDAKASPERALNRLRAGHARNEKTKLRIRRNPPKKEKP